MRVRRFTLADRLLGNLLAVAVEEEDSGLQWRVVQDTPVGMQREANVSVLVLVVLIKHVM